MCHQCASEVKEMDIRDSDLPYLPFKEVWEYCIVPGCKGRCKMRDYGISPYYYWPVKISNTKHGFRGGWVHACHGYLCSKHWKPIVKRQMEMPERTEEICLSRFKPVVKKGSISIPPLKL